MDKKPKTKGVVRSLKEHATADVKDKVKAAGIKSKDRMLEQVKEEANNQAPAPSRKSEPQSAESYATDRVEDSAQNMAETTVVTAERAVKYGMQKVREHRAEKQAAEQFGSEFTEETVAPEVLEQPLLEQQAAPTPGLPQTSTPSPKDVPTTPDVQPVSDTPYNTPMPTREEPTHSDTFPERHTVSKTASSDRVRQKQAPTVKEKAESPAAEVKSKVNVAREKSEVRMPRGRTYEGSTSDAPVSAESKRLIGQKQPSVGKGETSQTTSAEPTASQIQHGQQPVKKQIQTHTKRPVTASAQPEVDFILQRDESVSLPDQPTSPMKVSSDKSAIKTHERDVRNSDTVAVREKAEVHPREIRSEAKSTAKKQSTPTETPAAKQGKGEGSVLTAPKEKAVASEKAKTVKKAPADTVQKKSERTVKKQAVSQKRIAGGDAEKIGVQEKKASSEAAPKLQVPKQRKKTPPKLHQNTGLRPKRIETPTIKAPPAGMKQIKQSASASKNAHRSIKTVSESTKAAEKVTAKTVKAAKKTAQAAKKTEERARQAVQTTKKTVQATAKAVVQAVKASAKAVEGLAELLGISAPVVLLIIVVCLIAAIGGTCFGIFLSNDKSSGSEMTMAQAITELTTDYYDSITKFQAQYNYDDLEVKGSTAISWKDVLTIYAVKYTNDSDGFDVVTLDKKKLKKIKQILLDMNPCTGVVVEKVVPVTKTFTNSNGQKVTTTTYETQKVLIVTAVHVSAKEQARLYDFSDDAKAQVKEMLSSDYDELWNEIIGSSGEIINSSSTHVPNFIFAWPLDGDYRISSQFGTRTDPINGVVKTHGGTDIAAATGTPILAAADGVVEIAGYNAGGYGYYVKLSHGDGYETLYGHCSVLLVSTGQTVKQGQVIAKVGSTGHSTGPHLHFEVRYNGNKVNPMQFFQ